MWEANAVKNNIRSLISSNRRYYSNKNVIVMKKGETASAIITTKINGTLYLNSDNSYVTGKWDRNWSDGSCTVTFSSGYTTGKTVFTFTTEATSDRFEILIYVID